VVEPPAGGQSATGNDAGLEQQVFQLLESVDHMQIAIDALSEVEAAVERDAVVCREHGKL
jgi:hypothetical protein